MLVTTIEINERIATDERFAKDVMHAMRRFANMDWGDNSGNLTDEEWQSDWDFNNASAQALNEGKYGRVLGVYGEFWIIKDTQATTILFPHEY